MTRNLCSKLMAAVIVLSPIAAWAQGGAAPKPAQNPPAAAAPAARSLDELLDQTRRTREIDDQANAARIARFAAARDQQAKLLQDAQAEKSRQEAESATLNKQFEANEKQITDLQDSLKIKTGNLGELFGVLRQSAGDFSSVARNSLLSAEFTDRVAAIDQLAQTKTLPPLEDLERFWFEMQREMTETGKVVRFQANVIGTDGVPAQQQVVRVGPFDAFSDGRFLEYKPDVKTLVSPPKQPPGEFTREVARFEAQTSGYQPVIVDPSRGVLLGLFSQRPNVGQRIKVGGWVAYIILTVGAIGAVAAIFQFVYLTLVSAKVDAQLRNLNRLKQDNPLGRVLSAFKGEHAPVAGEETEVVELRISEAVLRELPRIERIQPLLKLVVAAGPLLGLVGTVIGMIETFQSITESGSSDPKLMAAGIGAAMIATVLGLGVAIPLLFVNSALASRSKRITQILDQQSTGLLAETLEAKLHA